MARPPALAGDTKKAKVSPSFIGWPTSIRLGTSCRPHGCLCEFERLVNLWPLGDVFLPLPLTNLAFNSIGVLATPQNVQIFRHVHLKAVLLGQPR